MLVIPPSLDSASVLEVVSAASAPSVVTDASPARLEDGLGVVEAFWREMSDVGAYVDDLEAAPLFCFAFSAASLPSWRIASEIDDSPLVELSLAAGGSFAKDTLEGALAVVDEVLGTYAGGGGFEGVFEAEVVAEEIGAGVEPNCSCNSPYSFHSSTSSMS